MFDLLRTKTFWTAIATGAAGVMSSLGVAPPILEAVAWGFAALTAACMRLGVLKSSPWTGPPPRQQFTQINKPRC